MSRSRVTEYKCDGPNCQSVIDSHKIVISTEGAIHTNGGKSVFVGTFDFCSIRCMLDKLGFTFDARH